MVQKNSSNMVADSNDESYFPQKLLLTNWQSSTFVKLLRVIFQLI